MAQRFTAHVTGLKELAVVLRELPDQFRRGALRIAMRKAAELIEADAKRRAPVLQKPDPRRRAGTLRDAISTRVSVPKGGNEVRARVGVRRLTKQTVSEFKQRTGRGATANPDDPFYAMMVERGVTRRQGGKIVQIPARPFMRPALLANAMQVVERFREEARREIDVTARKLLLHKGRRASGA